MVVKISIILPAYNVEKYISKTLDSIFDQLFRDFELIIIDDGSKDNTLNIIQNKMFETDIPIKLISQQNQGVSFSRNRGIDRITSYNVCYTKLLRRASVNSISPRSEGTRFSKISNTLF